MNKYTLICKRSAKKEKSKLPIDIQQIVAKELKFLKSNPSPDGCKKLRGSNGLYRIRVARKYRIVYFVDNVNLIVEILRISHRSEAYE